MIIMKLLFYMVKSRINIKKKIKVHNVILSRYELFVLYYLLFVSAQPFFYVGLNARHSTAIVEYY